jgi:hypothetical protein
MFEFKKESAIIETSSDSDAAPAAILNEPVKLTPDQLRFQEIKKIEQSVRLAMTRKI